MAYIQEYPLTLERWGDSAAMTCLEEARMGLFFSTPASEIALLARRESLARLSKVIPGVAEIEPSDEEMDEAEQEEQEADLFHKVAEVEPPLPNMGKKDIFGREGIAGTRTHFFKR